MQQILRLLPPGSRVLDLGSGPGSFDAAGFPLNIVRADIAVPSGSARNLVVCSAARLPFRDRIFQAVILNHSLEHFDHLADSVGEIARVIERTGFLYIAVPDASTFTDRVYRWLGRGGGHVNQFSDRATVPGMITAATGLKHAGTRVLCTSLSFLNRRNISRVPRKLLLFGNGNETLVRTLTWLLRNVDRVFHRRASVYGWAYYFGDPLDPDLTTWSNVCVRCGSADPSVLLRSSGRVVHRRALPAIYTCLACGGRNYFTDDKDFAHLR